MTPAGGDCAPRLYCRPRGAALRGPRTRADLKKQKISREDC